ncbi:STAS domain-containing protein [Actinokineospora auranticolor]|uniref:Anti-anti-sigma factor n=1 Tax=Actinokineospora auranticolor TaxID=155976 RepID=A0A2S6H0D8_9PSEU|nr:STAS domain-containing protein [Actinokineospora auranticolor]PPK70886.1 anti-anti-sigma factor [Actinokineospora auranticolor]
MKSLLSFARSATAGCSVLGVSGEVDMSSAHLLDSALSAAADEVGAAILILDLGDVRFLSAAGVDVVLNAHCRSDESGPRLIVVAPDGGPVHRTLILAGLDAAIALHPTLASALTAASGA